MVQIKQVKKFRPKYFDIMMGYLERDTAPTHAPYAWWFHSRKGAEYIRKLEALLEDALRKGKK